MTTKISRRDAARSLAMTAGGLAFATPRQLLAQDYPTKPIKFVVPFPPGGTLDQIARRIQPILQRELGQTIVIENKGGASGSIGTAAVAQAAPDGYTVLMVFDTHAVNQTLIKNLAYDTLKDFDSIMKIGSAPMILGAHPSTPYNSFADIVAAAKAKPGAVPYGTVGQGSLAHLAMSQIANELKVQWTHVPYKGGGPLTNDAVAGHVPLAISSIASLGPHVKAGKLRPIALTSSSGHPHYPGVPTIASLGVPNFSASAWWGLIVPAKTPATIIARLHKAFLACFNDPGVMKSLVDEAGLVYELSSPEQFTAFLKGEIDRWAKVVKDNNITGD